MTHLRFRTIAPFLIFPLFILSCKLFPGRSDNVIRPTNVVDLSSMAGKSLQELTTLLGPPRQQVLCYNWERAEGEIGVCYEGDSIKKYMSSISYELKPDPSSGAERGVGSLEEMMALVNIDIQGREAEENRRGFFTYQHIRINGKSCFVDVYPRGKNFIFGPVEPTYISAHLYILNPSITLYRSADHQGYGKTIHEQQTNANESVGSVVMGHGNWELCTEVNFTGNCKILDGLSTEYLENKNFSVFGLGDTIRSLRPVEDKAAATTGSSPESSATNNSPANTSIPASTTGVTMANYDRLLNGMTYAQVVKILGKEGERSTVLESGGVKIEMYKWAAADDGSDAELDAFFKNGKLDKKSQFALK